MTRRYKGKEEEKAILLDCKQFELTLIEVDDYYNFKDLLETIK